jgi:hypothetical protein
MGTGRGGWYSIDACVNLLNRVKTPSATTVLERYQDIGVGDVLDATDQIYLTAAQVERERYLVLTSSIRNQVGWPWAASWSWSIVPQSSQSCRLLFRETVSWHTAAMGVIALQLDWIKFPLFRRNLLGIKQRAENLQVKQ